MNAAHVASDPRLASRLELAELTLSLGAGVLGAGIGVLLTTWLDGLGLPILAVGLLLHAWGMRDKHALEAGAPQPAWSTALYWACWLILGALALYAIARVAIGS
jgi:hypothetical protein